MLGILAKGTEWVIRDWMRRKCEEHWQSIHGLRQAKCILNKPSVKKAEDLLGQSRKQLRIMMGLLTCAVI